jgi:hypothetical protein
MEQKWYASIVMSIFPLLMEAEATSTNIYIARNIRMLKRFWLQLKTSAIPMSCFCLKKYGQPSSVRHHFIPHLVINYFENDKCLFLHIFFVAAIFSATSFKEVAAEMNRYVSKKINDTMPLKKKTLDWIRWKDVTTKKLVAFLGVILNMAKHVKCSIKNFFCSRMTLHGSTRIYFQGRNFYNYTGIFMTPPS